MSTPKSNLTCVTGPSSDTGDVDFWLSDPEAMEDGDGDWGFALFASKDVWLCTFTYASQHAASRAREAFIPVLREATFIATSES